MATPTTNPFTLVAPCARCPFRSDIEPYLRPERAKQIADGLRQDGTFDCHKTVDYDGPEDADGMVEPRQTEKTKVCAGALITMEKEGYSNGHVRVAARLGMYDPERLLMDSPVYASLAEWVKAHRTIPTVTTEAGEVLEFEHCGVVGPDCEDPAGFMYGGGAVANDDEPTCDPTQGCQDCGASMCGSCSSEADETRCVNCVESAGWEDDDDDGA